jgi:hypothetical protein
MQILSVGEYVEDFVYAYLDVTDRQALNMAGIAFQFVDCIFGNSYYLLLDQIALAF